MAQMQIHVLRSYQSAVVPSVEIPSRNCMAAPLFTARISTAGWMDWCRRMEGYGLAANDLFGLVKSSRGHWVVVISISNLPDQKESRFPAIKTPDSLCLCGPNTDVESAENNRSFYHSCDFECASRAAIPELLRTQNCCAFHCRLNLHSVDPSYHCGTNDSHHHGIHHKVTSIPASIGLIPGRHHSPETLNLP